MDKAWRFAIATAYCVSSKPAWDSSLSFLSFETMHRFCVLAQGTFPHVPHLTQV